MDGCSEREVRLDAGLSHHHHTVAHFAVSSSRMDVAESGDCVVMLGQARRPPQLTVETFSPHEDSEGLGGGRHIIHRQGRVFVMYLSVSSMCVCVCARVSMCPYTYLSCRPCDRQTEGRDH